MMQLMNLLDRAAHNNVFHAMMVVEVCVLRTNDQVPKVMLGFDDFLRDPRFVVVVNERDNPGDDGTFLPLPLHQCRTDEMLDRFGASWKTLVLNLFVKMLDDVFFN